MLKMQSGHKHLVRRKNALGNQTLTLSPLRSLPSCRYGLVQLPPPPILLLGSPVDVLSDFRWGIALSRCLFSPLLLSASPHPPFGRNAAMFAEKASRFSTHSFPCRENSPLFLTGKLACALSTEFWACRLSDWDSMSIEVRSSKRRYSWISGSVLGATLTGVLRTKHATSVQSEMFFWALCSEPKLLPTCIINFSTSWE